MTFIVLAVGILATWRVTHLVVEEDGPWDVLRRIRGLLLGVGAGRLVNCFLCASVWIAVGVALLLVRGLRDVAVAAASFSCGAILLQRIVPDVLPAEWVEEKEESP
jgi:hypothetical protein